MATRLQPVLTNLVGEQQQGFVQGRLMERSVTIMLSLVAKAETDTTKTLEQSPGLVLHDLAKAYDTVDRDYLYAVLRHFGFSDKFVQFIRCLYAATSSQFVVNATLSDPLQIQSGIRQGCPLAPLLFILAAEILSLAIHQDARFRGLPVGQDSDERYKIGAFVDDTHVALEKGDDLPLLLQVLAKFGRLSGLRVQIHKSIYIPLNKCHSQTDFHGMAVLPHGSTNRFLGIQIGTGPLMEANWGPRIEAVRKRLGLLSKVSNSVLARVKILNAIVLPAVLFTANYVLPAPEILNKQLQLLQKQYIWQGTLSEDKCRHRMKTLLLFTPRSQGGVGRLWPGKASNKSGTSMDADLTGII